VSPIVRAVEGQRNESEARPHIMKRQGKSPNEIHDAVMAQLHEIATCDAVNDVVIEVNWDRPPGFANWWVTRIKYRSAGTQRAGIFDSGKEVARVEAQLQTVFFAERDGFSMIQ
jgi:hypothetical protein